MANNLLKSWLVFRRGKRARTDVLVFERHLEENIFQLQAGLAGQQYKHEVYTPFKVFDPKQRQIHKASVRDRLVHQAVVTAVEPAFERGFIFDSYSCRKGKGTHAGVKRLRKFLRQASRNDTRTVYGLKCDIKQFFASVDHQILLQLIQKKIDDQRTLWLIGEIINSFSMKPAQGIPLGNLTSQLFANIYMHELDWFVKHHLREKFYLRYCDDFVIVGESRQHLQSLIQPMTEFLADELELSLHPHKVTIRSWSQGIDFLGYVLKPDCTVLRNKTKYRMLGRVNKESLSSYLGLCSHANTYRLKQIIQTKAWDSSKK